MDGLYLYLPDRVGLAEIAHVLESTFDIDDQTTLERPQVVVRGSAMVYVNLVDESDNAGCWPRSAAREIGSFICLAFESHDFARIAEVVHRVVVEWPALIDDDRHHVFRSRDFVEWLDRHPSPSWWEVQQDALLEMPVLEIYDCDDDQGGIPRGDQPASSQSSS